jgi:NADH-quinone oxidoreductase subunit L
MMVAMGVSAYSAGMFHLLTHACFKALLFLAAGSVIVGMHHEQDMQKMGGLYKKMPITYLTYLIGCLALCAIPPFAGFYSKDTIIEATKLTHIAGGSYAYFCVVAGAAVTAIYTFRSLFLTFHGKPRMDEVTYSHVKESPFSIVFPLVMLAIPSVLIGYVLFMPMLFDTPTLLSAALYVKPEHDVLAHIAKEGPSALTLLLHAPFTLTFWLVVAGIGFAVLAYLVVPHLPQILSRRFAFFYRVLMKKYGFDTFNTFVFIRGIQKWGNIFYRIGDKKLIDGMLVNGTGKTVRFIARKGRAIQDGYVNHYAAMMVLGLFVFLCWLLKII